MTTAEVLRAAAKRLREQGWQRSYFGNYSDPSGGPCCLVGALRSVRDQATDTDDIEAIDREWNAYARARNVIDDKTGGATSWNDHVAKGAEEVIALLEDTASELERAA